MSRPASVVPVVPPPGPHGGDAARLAAALGVDVAEITDLSLSVNPVAPAVAPLVARASESIARYPDDREATDALAVSMQVDPARLVLTNGGAEAIALVAAEHPVGNVDEPEFSLYARHLREVSPAGPRWRSNPHNPSGRLADADERAVVWDEAFFPLATGRWTRGDDAIVVGSLTKLFACPGLRMGYALARDPGEATRLRARQPEWSFGALAAAVLPELVARADLGGWARAVDRSRRELVDVLEAVGLQPDPSDAPFVLVRSAPGLRERLARRRVLVRDTASFGIPNGVRIAVPGAVGMERLADALAASARRT